MYIISTIYTFVLITEQCLIGLDCKTIQILNHLSDEDKGYLLNVVVRQKFISPVIIDH